MNTRSSTFAAKCPTTVECLFQPPESHDNVLGCQNSAKNSKNKEIVTIENDLKRKPHVELLGEEGEKRKNIRQDVNVKGDLSCGVTTRSNVRQGKRARVQTPESFLNATPDSSKSSNKRLKAGRKGKKRQWESWAPNEKDCFFEALNEHGKDFDKIHTYVTNVYKRRGDVASERNKDQVRHFYYRTLNKISKYIPEAQDPSDAKKAYHEVRSLICYGELRKKFRSLKEKDGKKLTELISTGKTTLRHHGRNVCIRAPTCRALKKLNPNVSEEHEQIPQKIIIEFIPSENKTWSTIQRLSHNPRLRTTVSTRKTICSLITFLRSKWKLQDDMSVSLSLCSSLPSSKQSSIKSNENETVAKMKKAFEVNEVSAEVEIVCENTESPKDKTSKNASFVKPLDAASSTKTTTDGESALNESVSTGKAAAESSSSSQETWTKSNCGNLTIAGIYRKMNNPRKILLNYSIDCRTAETLGSHALEQLVKLAAGEFTWKNKKPEVMSSSKTKGLAKDPVVSKPNKITRPTKSASKPPKPLAPKPSQEVVPPTLLSATVINKVSTNSSTKSGNHLTFGFTPINSFPRPSPFLPKPRKRQAARVVVQRTLLPRPHAGGATATAVPFPPSAVHANQDGLVNSGLLRKQRIERKILPKESTIANGETSQEANSNVVSHSPGAKLTVDSLLNIAMNQELPGHLETLILSKSLNVDKSPSDHVCTEEIDSGVAGQGEKCLKEVENLTNALTHLDSTKRDAHSIELIDNLKSSEDEDPFKFLSPSHLPNFPPEGWLNEESADFSLGTLLAGFETSPSKHRQSSVLDTPKKSAPASDSDLKNSHTVPMFCDLVDDSSVDYVKKFRDLAKKMGNDHESSSSDNLDPPAGPSLSFKSLLSEASK